MKRGEFLEGSIQRAPSFIAQAAFRGFLFCYPSLIYLRKRNRVLQALVLFYAHPRVIVGKVQHGIRPLLEIFQILKFLGKPLPIGIPTGADRDPHGVGLAALAGELDDGTI